MPDLPPNDVAVRQVAALQRDGLLLIAYLAERPDRELVRNGRDKEDAVQLALLTAPAAEVAADPEKFEGLLRTIDRLGRSAEPATTTTIRVTTDYLLGTPDLTSDLVRKARKAPRRTIGAIIALLLLATGLSVWLLAHVDEGRRTMAQLAQVREELARTFVELAKLGPEDWVPPREPPGQEPRIARARRAALPPPEPQARPAPFVEFCEPDPPEPRRTAQGPASGTVAEAPPYSAPASFQAQHLCSRLYQLRLREALVYDSLVEWNCVMFRLRPVNWLGGGDRSAEAHCLRPPFRPTPPASPEHWQRTELRTGASIALLTGYILPVLLGAIGGCVYVLRRMSDKIDHWTLTAKDGTAGLARVALAGACGGLLGLILGTESAVQLGGFSLSLAAWAFFLGYALETVLRLLDTIIRAVVERLQPAEPRKEVRMSAKAS